MRVSHGLQDLESDFRQIVRETPTKLVRAVRSAATQGNAEARSHARESAGAHGKHYHKAFSVERAEGFGLYAFEYGPEADKKQGGMSFENGSRNQPPHNDLAKSADFIGPRLRRSVAAIAEGAFWPS